MDDMADHPNAYDRFIRLPEVLKITGLSASSVYRLRAKGEFPAQRLIGPRSVRWSLREVLQWLDDRPDASTGRASE